VQTEIIFIFTNFTHSSWKLEPIKLLFLGQQAYNSIGWKLYVDFKNGLNLEIPFRNESYSPFFGHPGHVEGGGEEFVKID